MCIWASRATLGGEQAATNSGAWSLADEMDPYISLYVFNKEGKVTHSNIQDKSLTPY